MPGRHEWRSPHKQETLHNKTARQATFTASQYMTTREYIMAHVQYMHACQAPAFCFMPATLAHCQHCLLPCSHHCRHRIHVMCCNGHSTFHVHEHAASCHGHAIIHVHEPSNAHIHKQHDRPSTTTTNNRMSVAILAQVPAWLPPHF